MCSWPDEGEDIPPPNSSRENENGYATAAKLRCNLNREHPFRTAPTRHLRVFLPPPAAPCSLPWTPTLTKEVPVTEDM